MDENIYDQLGGFVVVRKIVVEFYNNVLEIDNCIADVFRPLGVTQK